ncbi:MAG: phenylalanine--tRNA ligase subunit beta [Gemmatimonadota bacterium]
MDISVNWLRALLPGLDGTPFELADRLSMRAIPVDRAVAVGEGLGGIVVARVLETRPHPNADRLTLCRVDAGGDETIDVVCGAPSVETGALYPYVPTGAELPGGFRIESRRIRGEMSHGMLCSEKELGLGRDAAGILRLRGEFVPGQPFAVAMGLPDARLELDLTPNRIDLACHLGVARELATEETGPPALPDIGAPEPEPAWADGVSAAGAGGVRIAIDDPDRCFRYLGAVVRGVRVGPSPDWLQARLRGAGARPINNVVDATNYVLLELNQPLHAFDLDRVGGGGVRVRAARAGETLRTLDGVERTLSAEATVIADADRPIALAGVMGGEESEVSETTTDLLLECASFDPRHARHTARSTGLATDASYRFERGIDERGMEAAIRRCVGLILATAGGRADGSWIRVGRPAPERRTVDLRPSRVRQVLGLRLATGGIVDLLTPIGFEPAAGAGEGEALRLLIPGWRGDVATEADLLEEIARLHGYDAFPDEPRRFRPSVVPDSPEHRSAARVRQLLAGRGFLEARSVPFVPAERAGALRVPLLRPLSAAEGFLRTDLVPVLLARLEHNWSRGRRDVRLFEVGTVFARPSDGAERAEGPFEELRFAFVLTGAERPVHWSGEARDFDLWDCKGVVEELCAALGVGVPVPFDGAGTVADVIPFDVAAWLGGERLAVRSAAGLSGFAGSVRAEAVDAPPWAAPAWAGEFRLAAVSEAHASPYRALPTFPSIARDLAFTLSASIPASAVEATIREASPRLLESLRLFDVYEGETVEEGRRSLAWRLVFRAPDRTLTDPEVEAAVGAVVNRLEEEFDVRIRAS